MVFFELLMLNHKMKSLSVCPKLHAIRKIYMPYTFYINPCPKDVRTSLITLIKKQHYQQKYLSYQHYQQKYLTFAIKA